MSSWRRLRLSLRLDKDLASDNVCWRCALRRTQKYSYTVKASASKKKRFPREKHYGPFGMTANSQRDCGRDVQRQVVLKHAVSEAKPVHQVRAKSIRRVLVNFSSETTPDTVDEEGQLKYRKVGVGGHTVYPDWPPQPQQSGDKTSRRKIYRLTFTPSLEASTDMVRDETVRETLKTGRRRIVLDTAVRYVQSPSAKEEQKANNSVEEVVSQRALSDVLNAFDDLYARLNRHSPKSGVGLGVDLSRSTKANTIGMHTRPYTTSTVSELDL